MTAIVNTNPPSIPPEQQQSLMGTINFLVDKLVMQEIDKMMPCSVVAVDRTKNRVSVQIMVSMVTTAKENVIRAQVPSIPIYSPSAGGYVINFPVQSGDLGWIKATDTDISLFLQTLSQSPPNTEIFHKFDSASFWPDNMNKGVTIAEGDASNLVIQTYDGTTKISVGAGTITMVAPTNVHITTPTLNVTGAIVATGEVTGNSITLSTHVHGGIYPGGSDTSGPIG